MRSMTGFGAGDAPFANGTLGVEIRGTNHRFLDLRVRLPEALADLASFVEELVRERRLARGRFDVTAHLDGGAAGTPVLDAERVRAAYHALERLRDELAPNQEIPLALLLHVPGVFAPPLAHARDRAKGALAQALGAAIDAMQAMRAREGAALASDFAERLARVRARTAEIRARAPEVVEAHQKRLLERVARLRADGVLGEAAHAGEAREDTLGGVPAQRLAQEIALFADRADIAEELTRLGSHFDQAEALLAAEGPLGRRLDFLLQEMAREANTIGAKSADAAIAHAVVEVKAEIERMREQAQNIE